MDLVIFAVIGMGIVGLVVWTSVRETRKANANMQALALRLGLEFRNQKSPGRLPVRTVSGQQAGREVIFYRFTTGSGKNSQTWRAVSVRPRATGKLTFNLHRQGLGTKIEALFGAKEAVVGEAIFDQAWFLQTNDADFLGAALVPEVRAKLMTALAAGGRSFSFRLVDGAVRYAETGSYSSAPGCVRMETMLPVLHDLADIAEVAAGRNPAAG